MRWPVDDIEFEPPMPPVRPTTYEAFWLPACVVELPYRICSRLTSSSSAATMRKPVAMPLPGSPWLVLTLTVLSALIVSHESSWASDGLYPFADGAAAPALPA